MTAVITKHAGSSSQVYYQNIVSPRQLCLSLAKCILQLKVKSVFQRCRKDEMNNLSMNIHSDTCASMATGQQI